MEVVRLSRGVPCGLVEKQIEYRKPILPNRRAGIILHPISLPKATGDGDIGREVYRFVEFSFVKRVEGYDN